MRKFTSTLLNMGLICVVDIENQAEKESKNVDVDEDQVSFSSLSEFSVTPTYSQVSPSLMEEERDASSIPVEIDCEVRTSGEGVEAPKTYYQPLPHGAAYFGRKPGMARTKQTARKSGKLAINPAKFRKARSLLVVKLGSVLVVEQVEARGSLLRLWWPVRRELDGRGELQISAR